MKKKVATACTVKNYSKLKKLLVAFLLTLGLKTVRFFDNLAVQIPYLDERGEVVATRYRMALTKADGIERFKWKKGSRIVPYGLWRLGEAREAGYIVKVEGESNAQTLWSHGIPAIGIPGATNWRREWAEHLDGIPLIYDVIDPDKGGEATIRAQASSPIRDRIKLVSLKGFKDVSEMHVANPKKFRKRWKRALRNAVPFAEHERFLTDMRRKQLWEKCRDLAQEPRILDVLARDLKAVGFAGSKRIPKLLYVIFTTRLLQRPISAVVKGTSSVGKTYAIETVRRFFSTSTVLAMTGMSDRAIVYAEESYKHRVIILYEADVIQSDFLRSIIQSLLTENIIRYSTVEKIDGRLRTRIIEQEGPASLITATTAAKLHDEMETRMFTVPVRDSRKRTQAIMAAQAEAAERGDVDAAEGVDFERWHALQEWLTHAEHRVKIPYAKTMTGLIPPMAVRLHRDMPAFQSAIKSLAIIHQATRKRDAKGQIIANFDDYRVARHLFVDIVSEGVDATVSRETRATVRAVKQFLKDDPEPSLVEGYQQKLPTSADLARLMNVDKSTAWRRVKVALSKGYLVNEETRRGRPARLNLGEPLPKDQDILPPVKVLKREWKLDRKKVRKSNAKTKAKTKRKGDDNDGWTRVD